MTVKFQTSLRDVVAARLDERAAARGCSRHALVQALIMDEHEPPLLEAWHPPKRPPPDDHPLVRARLPGAGFSRER